MSKLRVNIKPQLEKNGYQNEDNRKLAAMSGIHENTIGAWRRGVIRRIDLDTLEVITEFLDCAPGDLIVSEATE